jgi:quercetin dioxygenase-like cupin family protein
MNNAMKYVELDNIKEATLFPGFNGKFVSSKEMSFVYWRIPAGSPLPAHSHRHEQVSHTIEGTFEMTVDGRTQILGPGSVAVIPSNAVHSGKAITDCYILDAFSPGREDYQKYE